MIRYFSLAIAAFVALVGFASASQAGVQVNVSADQDGIKSFYLEIGEQYRVPEKEVVVIRERRIPDDELPVVFFLARHASVEPDVIVTMRLGGQSWMDIALHYRLLPEIFYVQFDRDPGPPYGRAWGHFKHHKRSEWKEIRLEDDDIVNLVDLKFVSERYGCTPMEVVRLREKENSFVVIHRDIRAEKEHSKVRSKEHSKHKSKSEGSSEHGHGHGNGNGDHD